jgi:uncharacterized protein YjaZ
MITDFKVFDHRDSKEKGVTLLSGKGRIFIYLHQHENIEDIYSTITHELIHYCIDKLEEEIDEYEEHDLIFKLQWIDEYVQ